MYQSNLTGISSQVRLLPAIKSNTIITPPFFIQTDCISGQFCNDLLDSEDELAFGYQTVDYVHGVTVEDQVWGMDKVDILFGNGGNKLILGDGKDAEWRLVE